MRFFALLFSLFFTTAAIGQVRLFEVFAEDAFGATTSLTTWQVNGPSFGPSDTIVLYPEPWWRFV
jgi:hypothetical protein